MALPSAHRLKSRHDFQAVFREGIRRHGSYMTLRALRPSNSVVPSQNTAVKTDNPGEKIEYPPAQIGISISTKVSKRAVVRNRIKRKIAAALHKLLPRLSPGWRLVFVVKPSVTQEECVTQQFLQELEQLLAQAEVFNGHP
ncbi:ribonuclease P protein component [Brunnivagina elsteri]|uniref:Ribonuclease P protein component n=1 Tax=Brunnivagina elsteri CCALA 953 TaxID=987040 RepID=A0A2A2TAQ2_9CYAN|nr:ribonuclease P protein component [Calothrix elsteri]PAX47604.1 ribonuclease P protein component [Calothrix elsteri CCALA 953]